MKKGTKFTKQQKENHAKAIKNRKYKSKKCDICGTIFSPTNGQQKRCKKRECYLEYERARSKRRNKDQEYVKKRNIYLKKYRKNNERYRKYVYEWYRKKKGTFETPCKICGELRNTELCHIIPRKDGGNISEENTLILCPTHHKILDNWIIKSLGNQFTDVEFNRIKDKVNNQLEKHDTRNSKTISRTSRTKSRA